LEHISTQVNESDNETDRILLADRIRSKSGLRTH